MKRFHTMLAALAAALLIGGGVRAGSVTSGPQVGEKAPGPFKPLNVTGPDAGQAVCQYCKNGPRPVAVVFARQITPALLQLIQKIDAATAADKDHRLGSYVVVCSDVAGMDRYVQGIGQQMRIQNTILTLYKATGPEKYRLAPEAEVTVLLYDHFTVKANHAFKSGELNERAIQAILVDLGKMRSEN